jgi:hypothetical protein
MLAISPSSLSRNRIPHTLLLPCGMNPNKLIKVCSFKHTIYLCRQFHQSLCNHQGQYTYDFQRPENILFQVQKKESVSVWYRDTFLRVWNEMYCTGTIKWTIIRSYTFLELLLRTDSSPVFQTTALSHFSFSIFPRHYQSTIQSAQQGMLVYPIFIFIPFMVVMIGATVTGKGAGTG